MTDGSTTSRPEAIDVAAWCAIAMSEAAPILREWMTEPTLRRNVMESIERALAAKCRRVALRPGRTVLTSRHEFIDAMPIPHLYVHHRSFHVDDPQDLRELASLASGEDADIQRVGFFRSGPHDSTDEIATHAAVIPYKRHLAAPAAEILAATPKHADDVVIRKADDLAFYDDYSQMYDDFHADVPDLVDHVRKESPDDLRGFQAEGVVALVNIDGILAGVMAATPACEHGLRGWMMKERIFSRQYRGGGYGPAALWAFLRMLPLEPDDFFWGTIVPDNHASLKSALRLGRVDIGGWYWIDVQKLR